MTTLALNDKDRDGLLLKTEFEDSFKVIPEDHHRLLTQFFLLFA